MFTLWNEETLEYFNGGREMTWYLLLNIYIRCFVRKVHEGWKKKIYNGISDVEIEGTQILKVGVLGQGISRKNGDMFYSESQQNSL